MLGAAIFRIIVSASASHAEDPVRNPSGVGVSRTRGGYVGAVTRIGVRFRGVNITEASVRCCAGKPDLKRCISYYL